LTDVICREGIQRVSSALLRAYQDGKNVEARQDMALVSLCGGLALANAKLGAVHGFAGVIGGMFAVPHGIVCGRLLPFVMETNVEALQTRSNGNPALRKYTEIAKLLLHYHKASAADGVTWVRNLASDLKIPGLGHYGITQEHFPSIISKAKRSSSMKGNPIQLSDDELTNILYQAL
jgi:alcohol dehydrogenase class IV